ncbi:hypothetical protein [Embleya sp. NPDC005971]|uniref:hypothetical protein n=1 Tax=Embleya sp. NPDC005971 TaxID=3156724 RepID=UPI00340ECAC0
MFTDTDPFSDEDFERYERELPGALRAVGDTFPGPSSDLVARGLARGRQRRRFRTLRRSALAAVLVTASVAGWATVRGTFDASTAGPGDRPDTPWVTKAPRDLMPLLAAAVPADGGLTDGETHFEAGLPRVLRTEARVQATYRNPSGSSVLTVVINRPGPGDDQDPAATTCAGTRPEDECTRSTDPDNGVLIARKTSKQAGSVEQEWRAVYIRPDGAHVDVRVGGRYLLPGDTTGISVLSLEQIAAVARSASWEPVVAAIPTPAQQVAGLVPALLSPGSHVVSADGSSGTGEFVVDTQGRTNGLNVSAEAGPVGERPVCPPGVDGSTSAGGCEIVKLSDGTPARIDTERTEDGRYVPWALTAFRAHGLRIRFEANTPPVKERGEKRSIDWAGLPVIQEQAKTIAVSPRWDAP